MRCRTISTAESPTVGDAKVAAGKPRHLAQRGSPPSLDAKSGVHDVNLKVTR